VVAEGKTGRGIFGGGGAERGAGGSFLVDLENGCPRRKSPGKLQALAQAFWLGVLTILRVVA